MKTVCIAVAALFLATAPALADSTAFSENQSQDDQLFHIDIAVSHPSIGTIKVSLPGANARFDPAQPIDAPGYFCSVTTSRYGEPNTGFVCSTGGDRAGAVTIHLLSQDCYGPPPQGSAQPAVADVWPTPADPGTQPEMSDELYADAGCDSGADEPPVDVIPTVKCIVPKLKKLTLKKAKLKLKQAGCKPGKVKKAFSKTIKKGSVIKQSAKPGKRLKLNSKVTLTVSLGRKP